jgi:hypothetical protein
VAYLGRLIVDCLNCLKIITMDSLKNHLKLLLQFQEQTNSDRLGEEERAKSNLLGMEEEEYNNRIISEA